MIINFALLIGIYTYGIFVFGIIGILYKQIVIIYTLPFILVCFYWLRSYFLSFPRLTPSFGIGSILVLIVLQALVNLGGVMTPELSFDALWYHLTFPKLYLIMHAIVHFNGGLLYYSDMPKLGELLYVGALSFGNEILAKFIHFSFGVAICLVIFKLSRKYFSNFISVLAVLLFYSNIVVSWESTIAYIDLIRSFFEIVSLYVFLEWYSSRATRTFLVFAIMVGLAIATKILAIASLLAYSLLLLFILKNNSIKFIKYVVTLWGIGLLIPLPWLLFSYINTGNPVYPFFSNIYTISAANFNGISFIKDIWQVFVQSSDPISPVYLIVLPLIIIYFSRLHLHMKLVSLYVLFCLLLWYFTPRTGGGRFLLPYLSIFSILSVSIIDYLQRNKRKYLYSLLICVLFFITLTTLGYRFIATMKYFPVVFGFQSRHEFLSTKLNYGYGDFYDTDNYFKKSILSNETILLYGFHNLYYVDFAFIDSSWVKNGDKFNYIATQNAILPYRFEKWEKIYENKITLVKLYKPPKGICLKICVF